MSEHFSSRPLRVVSPTACTGTQFLIAVGMGMAVKADQRDEIVYVSGGEGSTSEGEFFEAVNKAQHDRLPVLFVIQNNGYAISVPQEQQTHSQIYQVAAGFGMKSVRVDGTRFTEMYNTLKPLVQDLREGRGPLFVEAMVVRLDSHSSSDDQTKYRDPKNMEEARRKDPLAHSELRVREMGLLTDREVEEWRARIKAEVEEAARRIDALPYPDASTAAADIYSADRVITQETGPDFVSEKPITMVEAINHGLREEMEANPKIVMWGEDIQDPKGGVFGVTRGLTEVFPGRVVNSPLAEATIVGAAQGMAIGGYKPVVEIQFGDYSYPGYMQMRNEIATLRWRSASGWTCPMVVRVAVGGYIRGGPFHSQTPETLYAHTPGWYLAYPSNAADAKGLIKAACRMDDPILFFEHKGLYRQVYTKTPEPGRDYVIPFGKARIIRPGDDLTVIAWGRAVHMVQQAISQVAAGAGGEPSVEVIDLRTVAPLDTETVLASLASSPLQHGAGLIITLTIVAAAAFGLFIVILGLALGSAERGMTLARLTVMGYQRTTGLVVAEAMPAVLAAVVAGVVCALALPAVVGPAIDLSAFTGTSIPVQLQPDALALGLPAVIIGVLALAALAAEARSLRRRDVSGMLRAN